MALFSVSPVNELLDLQRDLERTLERARLDLGVSGRGGFPGVNIFSNGDGYLVRIEVPGMSAEQLQISAQGQTLTVSGKRVSAAPAHAGFHRRERAEGSFSRSLQLPDDVDLGRAAAAYKNGILTIRVPRSEEAKPRQIPVQTV